MYHISRSGEPAECNAEPGNCPLKSQHFETEGETLQHIEETEMGSRAASLQAEQADTLFDVREVLRNSKLKDLDVAELTQTLLAESERAGLDRTTMQSVIGFASVLHSDQARGARGRHARTPYIEHPLRNSIRLLRMGVNDQDTIVSSVLHDTVEDCSQRYALKFEKERVGEEEARSRLLAKIKRTYGAKVESTVLAVTNPYLSPEEKRARTPEQKRSQYAEHVRDNIAGNPAAFMVKISDFFDNASSLHHSAKADPNLAIAPRARKYLPVVNIFREEGAKMNLGLMPKAKREIEHRLSQTERRLQGLS